VVKQLNINESVLVAGSGFVYEVALDIVRELRHAYQYEAALNPQDHVVSQETRRKWHNNLPNTNLFWILP